MEKDNITLRLTDDCVTTGIVAMADSLIIVSSEGYVLNANDNTYQMLGYEEHDLIGKPINTIVSLDEFPFEDEWIEFLIESGIQKNVEMNYLTKKGIVIPVLLSSSTLYNDDKEIKAILLLARNIAQHKSMEHELKKAMSYAQSIIDSSMDMIVATNDEGKITEFNKAAQRRYGFSIEEVMGRDVKFLHYNHDDVEKIMDTVKKFNEYRDEFIAIDKQQKLFPAMASASALRSDGDDIDGYMEIIRDMTEIKEADKYRRLLTRAAETMQIGITVTDIEGNIIYTNPSDAEMHGYTVKELSGLNVRLFAPENTWSPMTLRKILDLDSTKVWKRESINVRKDGSTFPVYLMSDVIKNDKGEPIAIVTSCEDITEKKHMQQELKEYSEHLNELVLKRTSQLEEANLNLNQEVVERKQAEKKLEELLNELQHSQDQLIQSEKMASLGQLVAGVAHEINNPLGFVNSNLTNLKKFINKITEFIEHVNELSLSHEVRLAFNEKKEDINYDYVKMRVETILERSAIGIERMKKIVLDLKTFSRLDAAEVCDADINEAIDVTLSLLTHEHKGRIEIKKEYGEIPLIKCYLSKLNQVFMNILVNACQAVDEKGEIVIKTVSEGDMISIEISDNGKGIEEENLKKIFDPFFTTKPVGEGTGLGLSISHKIVFEHKGRLNVKSDLGKGTTFTIKLPVEFKGGVDKEGRNQKEL